MTANLPVLPKVHGLSVCGGAKVMQVLFSAVKTKSLALA